MVHLVHYKRRVWVEPYADPDYDVFCKTNVIGVFRRAEDAHAFAMEYYIGHCEKDKDGDSRRSGNDTKQNPETLKKFTEMIVHKLSFTIPIGDCANYSIKLPEPGHGHYYKEGVWIEKHKLR